MSMLSAGLGLAVRIVLVLLFFPFSALDKVLNFRGAVGQASEVASSRPLAIVLILGGICIEVFMSLGVVTGIADRACASVTSTSPGSTSQITAELTVPRGMPVTAAASR